MKFRSPWVLHEAWTPFPLSHSIVQYWLVDIEKNLHLAGCNPLFTRYDNPHGITYQPISTISGQFVNEIPRIWCEINPANHIHILILLKPCEYKKSRFASSTRIHSSWSSWFSCHGSFMAKPKRKFPEASTIMIIMDHHGANTPPMAIPLASTEPSSVAQASSVHPKTALDTIGVMGSEPRPSRSPTWGHGGHGYPMRLGWFHGKSYEDPIKSHENGMMFLGYHLVPPFWETSRMDLNESKRWPSPMLAEFTSIFHAFSLWKLKDGRLLCVWIDFDSQRSAPLCAVSGWVWTKKQQPFWSSLSSFPSWQKTSFGVVYHQLRGNPGIFGQTHVGWIPHKEGWIFNRKVCKGKVSTPKRAEPENHEKPCHIRFSYWSHWYSELGYQISGSPKKLGACKYPPSPRSVLLSQGGRPIDPEESASLHPAAMIGKTISRFLGCPVLS